jgi:hypothetical protein
MNQVTQDLTRQVDFDLHLFAVEDFTNAAALLVVREADGQAEWHETQSGSATLIVGVTLLTERPVAPHEKRKGTIQGGIRQMLQQKTSSAYPAKTPHQFFMTKRRNSLTSS